MALSFAAANSVVCLNKCSQLLLSITVSYEPWNHAPNFASIDAGVAIAGGGCQQGSRGPEAAAGVTTATGAGAGGARDRARRERTQHHDPPAGKASELALVRHFVTVLILRHRLPVRGSGSCRDISISPCQWFIPP